MLFLKAMAVSFLIGQFFKDDCDCKPNDPYEVGLITRIWCKLIGEKIDDD